MKVISIENPDLNMRIHNFPTGRKEVPLDIIRHNGDFQQVMMLAFTCW